MITDIENCYRTKHYDTLNKQGVIKQHSARVFRKSQKIAEKPSCTLRTACNLLPMRRMEERLLLLLRIQDPQDGKEQVDDIEVQRDRCGDLLLDVVVAHNQLGVD